MPIGMGENVGTAYVRILADGSDIPDGIREGLEDSEGEFRAQGSKNSKAYQEGFDENYKRNTSHRQKQLAEALNLGAGRIDGIADTISDGLFDSLRAKIRKQAGSGIGDEVADVITNRLQVAFQKTGDLDGLKRSLEDLPRLVYDATEQVQQIEQRYQRDREAAYTEQNRRISREWTDLLETAHKMNREFDQELHRARSVEERDLAAQIRSTTQTITQINARAQRGIREDRQRTADLNRRLAQEEVALTKDIRKEYGELRAVIQDINSGNNALDRSQRDVFESLRRIRPLLDGIDNDGSLSRELERIDDAATRLRPRTLAMNRAFDRTADSFGRITGRGSRNNFLNFMGSAVRGITRLVLLTPRLAAKVGGDMVTSFQRAGGGMSGAAAAAQSLVGAAASGAAGLAVLAGAAVALSVILGPVVALFSLLLGVVTALAATLTFGLAGALIGTLALLVPLVAGVGVAVAAIAGLDDETKKLLKNDFKPLIKDAKDLSSAMGKEFADNLDGGITSRVLQTGLRTARSLLLDMSDSVGDVLRRFASIGESSAFRRFINTMESVLPNAIRDVGFGLADFTEGFLGFLRGLAPTIEDVAESFADLGDRFNEWANSKEGQESLRTFFEDASESLGKVRDLFKEVGGLIGDLFSNGGKDTGDDLFESMTDSIKEFRENLDGDEIERWFNDAKDLAEELGDTFKQIGELIDDLDSSLNRSSVITAFDLAADGVSLFTLALEASQQQTLSLMQLILFLGDLIATVIGGISSGIIDEIAGAVGQLASLIEPLADLPVIGDKFKGMVDPLRQAEEKLRGLADSAEDLGGTTGKIDAARESLSLLAKGVAPGDIQRVRDLQSAISNIPDDVVTEMVVEGDKLSAKKIQGLIKEYNLTPDEVETLTSVLGTDKAKGQLESLTDAARVFDRSDPNPLALLTDRASGPLGAVMARLLDVDGFVANSTVVTTYVRRYESEGRPGMGPDFLPTASGGMFGTITNGAQVRLIGEEGAEAVVPLNRPLSQVDPAVRWLSAIAQGLQDPEGPGGPYTQSGKTIDASGWQIITPSSDARAVAAEVLNDLAASVI